MKRGRKPKYSIEQRNRLLASLNDYISTTDIPILKEWCVANNIPSETVREWQEFAPLIKKCVDKKEVALEKLGLSGKIDKSMAIFSLKQLGWRDNQGLDLNLHVKASQKEIEQAFDAVFAGGEQKAPSASTGVDSR